MSVIKSNRPKVLVNLLDQRIPRNPKYENVQSKLDTGESLTKFLKRHENFRGSIKQQTGEIFPRIKISTLIRLIIQIAEIDPLNTDSTRSQQRFSNSNQSYLETTRSTLEDLIRGVGEIDVYKNHQKEFFSPSIHEHIDFESIDRPYLIVDLRDKDEFKTNHIVSAHHYPAAMLSRCSNNESKELLIYKNQHGKIIVLYDEDERIASQAATIMVERGYNNIFLLSGGLKHAVRKFPRGLLTGTCPLSWTLSNHSATANAARSSVTFPSREQFTHDDLEELNTQLEKNSLSMDTGTRLSRLAASKQSLRSSVASERSNVSNVSTKPWKP